MTHLSGNENYVGTNGATAWLLEFLKRKMFATLQIYPADRHFKERILPHKNRQPDHSLVWL